MTLINPKVFQMLREFADKKFKEELETMGNYKHICKMDYTPKKKKVSKNS